MDHIEFRVRTAISWENRAQREQWAGLSQSRQTVYIPRNLLIAPLHFGNMAAQGFLEANPIARNLRFRCIVPQRSRCVGQARGRQGLQVQAGTVVRLLSKCFMYCKSTSCVEWTPCHVGACVQAPGDTVLVAGATGGVGQILTAKLLEVSAPLTLKTTP